MNPEYLIGAICSGFCSIIFLWAAARERTFRSYPHTKGTVEEASVTSKATSEGMLHRLDISYRYKVAGQQYVGRGFGASISNDFITRRGAEAARDRLLSVQWVIVKYNPDNPGESCIPQPSFSWTVIPSADRWSVLVRSP